MKNKKQSDGKSNRQQDKSQDGKNKHDTPSHESKHDDKDNTNEEQDTHNMFGDGYYSPFDRESIKLLPQLFALYRWAKLEPKDKTSEKMKEFLKNNENYDPVNDIDDQMGFLHFFSTIRYNMRISYSLFCFIVHSYLIYWSFCRIRYHPNTDSLFFDVVYKFLPFLDNSRPFTFLDFSSLFQFYFYSLTFLSHFISRDLEVFFYRYFVIIINGLIWVSYWIVMPDNSDNIQYWWINPSSNLNYTQSRWVVYYSPIFYWLFFIYLRSSFIILVIWDYDKCLYSYNHDVETPTKEKMTKEEEMIENQLGWLRITWTQYCNFAPLLLLTLYKIALMFNIFDDKVAYIYTPGIFKTIFLGFTITIMFGFWFDFLTFAKTYVVWFEDFKNGLSFDFYGSSVAIGIIF